MNIGSIAFCSFGLCYINNISDSEYSIVLRNGNTFQLDKAAKLIEIPHEFVDYVEREDFKNYLTVQTRHKGEDYFHRKAVKSITVEEKKGYIKLIAGVQGTKRYAVTFTLEGNEVSHDCTCPVGYRCKHQAAVYYELKQYFSDLNEQSNAIDYQAILSDTAKPFENLETVKQKIKTLVKARGDVYLACRDVADATLGDLSGVRAALQMVFQESSCTKKAANELINAFAMCDKTNMPLRKIFRVDAQLCKEHYATIRIALKNRDDVDSGYIWQHSISENIAMHYFYNHQWRGVLDILVSSALPEQKTEYLLRQTLTEAKAEGPASLELACILICSSVVLRKFYSIAFEAASALENSNYLILYLRNYQSSSRTCLLRDPVTQGEPEQTDISALYAHFQPEWTVEEHDNVPCLCCSLVPKVYPKIQYVPLKFTADQSDSITVNENRIDNRQFSPIAEAVLADIRSHDGEQIDLKLNDLKRRIEIREQEKALERLSGSMDQLIHSLPEEEISFEKDSAVDILFFLESHTNASNQREWNISLQVGNARMYIVRDVIGFLDYFKTGATHIYGKQLTLTHLYENIRPEKRQALKMLQLCLGSLPSSINSYMLRREPTLSDESMAALLNALQGSSAEIDSKDYQIRLNAVSCKVSLDAAGRLRSSIDTDNGKLLKLGTELFLINDEAGVIDCVEGTEAQKQLYLFATENNGVNIMPVLSRFNEQIYPRFYSDIEVAEPMREKLHLSELKIDAYFDYTEGSITVRTAMSRDEQPVSENDLTLPMDKGRYSAYSRYIERMGFKDGTLKEESAVLAFFTTDMAPLKKYCNVFLSDSILNKKFEKFARPMIRIQQTSNIMQAFLENSEYNDEELKKIFTAIRRKKKFIQLKGNRVVDLTGSDTDEFQQAVTDIGLDQDHMTEPTQISTPQALRSFAHERECRIDEYLYKMIEDIRGFKNSDIPVPDLKATLRPYQTEGFRWLRTLADYHVGGILADDMGLGKTLQFIALLKSDTAKGPDLVVCPKSLVFNWINEYRRFDPDTKAVEIYGTPAARKETIASIDPDERAVYVTSYDSLRNDQEEYTQVFRYLVLDEAQYIKNVTAIKSRTVKKLKAQHRFALTGTPIENSILDLWSIFDFIMPGYFDEISTFKSEYNRDEKFTAAVARRIAPFILRRTKRDVLKDLPDKYERILTVEMKPEQRKIYDAYKREAAEKLALGAGAFDVLPYLMRLRQICDAPGLFVEGYKGGSGKLEALESLIGTALNEGHRILIFSQFVQALEQLSDMLRRNHIGFYTITGDTPAKHRIEQMNNFNEKHEINVFLISLKAGGTGLNLTGADMVIHLDPWWNVAAEDQASDRAHRIGQTRNVEVIRLICENSVEQRVIELQNMKKDIIDKLISNDDSSVTSISLEDITFILK